MNSVDSAESEQEWMQFNVYYCGDFIYFSLSILMLRLMLPNLPSHVTGSLDSLYFTF
jgi:hypothetical protein